MYEESTCEDSDLEDEQRDWEDRSSREDTVFEKIQAEIERRSSQNTLFSDTQNSASEEYGTKTSEDFTSVPYGFQPRAAFEHGRKNTDIMGC